MKHFIIFLMVSTALWFFVIREKPVNLRSGAEVKVCPVQKKIFFPKKFEHKGYTVTPLADYQITAKVLSKKEYTSGRELDLSTYDLAVGWANMSDESLLSDIQIWHEHRCSRWKAQKSLAIHPLEIRKTSANMHIIAADEDIESKVAQAQKGDIIKIQGKLVRVDHSDGWHWVTSLSREDTGLHACEVIWVDFFDLLSVKEEVRRK